MCYSLNTKHLTTETIISSSTRWWFFGHPSEKKTCASHFVNLGVVKPFCFGAKTTWQPLGLLLKVKLLVGYMHVSMYRVGTANQMGNPRKAFEGVEGCGEC